MTSSGDSENEYTIPSGKQFPMLAGKLGKKEENSSSEEEPGSVLSGKQIPMLIGAKGGKQLPLNVKNEDSDSSESYASIDSSDVESLSEEIVECGKVMDYVKIDTDKYKVSEYVVDQLLLIAKEDNQDILFDEDKSEEFRKLVLSRKENNGGVANEEGGKEKLEVAQVANGYRGKDTADENRSNRKESIDIHVDSTGIRKDSIGSRKDSIDSRKDSIDSRKDTIDRIDSIKKRNESIESRKASGNIVEENKKDRFKDVQIGKREREEKEMPALLPMKIVVKKKKIDYASMDALKLRKEAEEYLEKARNIKHLGDKSDKNNRLARGKYYLRSSILFFRYALLLETIKMVYKAQNDAARARMFGTSSIKLFSQTGGLVESAASNFKAGQHSEILGPSYKFAAIVYMYIFRLQRTKLQAIHADMSNARKNSNKCDGKRSPISPAPSVGSEGRYTASPSQDAALGFSASVNSTTVGVPNSTLDYYLKESGSIFKAFELWESYLRCSKVPPESFDFASIPPEDAIYQIQQHVPENQS